MGYREIRKQKLLAIGMAVLVLMVSCPGSGQGEWGAVSGLSPADGTSTPETRPTFSWDAVTNAAGYEVQLADSEEELETSQAQSVTDASYTPSSALAAGQTHYWRVRAKDGAGQKGIWSAAYSLEVAAPQGFVHLAGGTFQMGSTDNDASNNEAPVHSVTVDSFYMAETELTFDQYDEYCTAVGISKPSDFGFGRGSRPVINVSWYDAVNYCNWLSGQEGITPAYEITGTSVNWNQSANGYRLPTEAEWEYAARGGAQSKGYKYAGSNDAGEAGWNDYNSDSMTHPVKNKMANELGLYDMSGNVWELCWDRYAQDYYSSSPEDNPTGPASGDYRTVRGGSWFDSLSFQRSAARGSSFPNDISGFVGFRLVRRT